MNLRVSLAALLLAVAVLLPTPAAALNPDRRLSAYKHSRWTALEGAPPIIYSLTQDREGYLIIGSASGLYRFDGMTFEHIPAPNPEISHGRVLFLLSAQDGTIWLAYDTGVIATYRHGVLRIDPSVSAVPFEPNDIRQTRDGTIWVSQAGLERTLLRRRNGRWQPVTPDYDKDDHSAPSSLFASTDGSLWMQTDRSIYRMREGQTRFDRIADIFGRTVLSEDRDGRIWASDNRGTRPLLPTASKAAFLPTPPFRRWTAVTRFDREGNLWIANGQGLFRARLPRSGPAPHGGDALDPVEGLTSKDGLTADTTTPLFEDREGNIWVGTTRGLDQFRDVSIVNEPALVAGAGRSVGLLAASDGSVYVGASGGLYRIRPGGLPQLVSGPLVEPRLICEAAGGDIWAMGKDAFVHVKQGVARRVPVPAPFRKLESYNLGGCVTDRRGVLWVSRYWVGNPDSGTFVLDGGQWRHLPGSFEDWPQGIDRTANGDILAWMKSGRIGLLDAQGKVARPLATLPPFNDHTIQSTSNGIVLGGKMGLVRVVGGKLQIMDQERFPWIADPTGLAETPDGETWMLGRAGVVGMKTAELGRAFGDPNARLHATVLNFEDGLPEVRSLAAQNGAVRGGDGRIWFTTVGGVVWLDPARLVRNTQSPLVHIRGLTAGSRPFRDPPASIELARGTTNVAIRYAGLSLTLPQRVRFRYQLEGVDDKWVDPGVRREAFYTNLGAGTYRFRVIAANNDGVWNRQGATIQFTIPPTFLQSIWFKLLCVVLLGLFIVIVVRIRTRAVRAGLQARFDARIAERERIARELHDTLLQSVQGLILVVQSAVEGLSMGNPLRKSIEAALDRADAVLGEGRDQVQALRGDVAASDLPDTLRKAAAGIVAGRDLSFQFVVEGSPRIVNAVVSREVLRIAEEAVRNAARHAMASRIVITLRYDPTFRLEVRDDGRGIDPEILSSGGREGHYGMIGMRERAAQIAGRLEIGAGATGGTEVRLSIPGRIAYREFETRLRDRLLSGWRRALRFGTGRAS